MGIVRTLAVKGATLLAVLFCVLLLTVVVVGATGLSDKILNAMMNEELRATRQKLATQIKDPEQLEQAMEKTRPIFDKALVAAFSSI